MSNETAIQATTTHSPSYGKLALALSKAQGVMAGAKKDATNPHLKNKYADLASVWDACREPLSKNELAVVQMPEADGKKVRLRSMLIHSSGEFLETTAEAEAKDASPQSIGSVLTYLRRYTLSAMVGIAPEDDDGEAAQPNRPQPHQSNKQSQPTAQGPKPAATIKPDEAAELRKHLGDLIKREGFDPEAIKAWCVNRGYPDSSAKLNAEQLTELIEYLTKKESA
jgi:hypothetical protein